tara:strand:- start:41 stop:511 length:471 start_codon:yes stop_codon:yes gene_type:complete
MNKKETWDSWGGNMGPSTPVPAGSYVAKLNECKLTYDNDGTARTELTFIILEGEQTGRYLWLDYPHLPKFGFLARMMWDACLMQGMPEGDNPEQMLLTMCRTFGDMRGRPFMLTTTVRTYQTSNGETKSRSNIKKVAPVNQQPPQNAAPVGDAPEW